MDKQILKQIQNMTSSQLDNYVVPGLRSRILGNGIVRVFENTRAQEHHICPHSHRYDFFAVVLQGSVSNRIWKPTSNASKGDLYESCILRYSGAPGKYTKEAGERQYWVYDTSCYSEKTVNVYYMTANQIHSIVFSKDAIVAFFEGPTISDTSVVLEPVVEGKRVDTLYTHPWMFETALTRSTEETS